MSSCGENIVQGFGQNSSTKKTSWGVEKFGCKYSPVKDIEGGNLSQNLQNNGTAFKWKCTNGANKLHPYVTHLWHFLLLVELRI